MARNRAKSSKIGYFFEGTGEGHLRYLSILLVMFIYASVGFAESQANGPLIPKKLFKKLNSAEFSYIEKGKLDGFLSIESCLFTSDEFIILKNYCYPQKKYPARGFTVMSPEYGIFEFYQENRDDIEARSVRVLVFAEDLDDNLQFPVKGMTLEKANRIAQHYYFKRNRACWATNYSFYSGQPDVNCIHTEVDLYPEWKKEALEYANDQKDWYEDFAELYGGLQEPFLEDSLTQFYEGRGNFNAEALYSPAKQYDSIVATLSELATLYPQNVEVFELAKANTGESIYGLKVGHGEVHNLVVGTHHGNEYGSTEVAEALAIDLAKNPIEGQTIYIIPVLNVNGYNSRSRLERTETGRRVDPNRDYPGPCGTAGPFLLNSTRALADFMGSANIVNSVTLHTHFPAVLYPWGISTHDIDTEYTELFIELGIAATEFSKYQVGNSTALLYPADGTFEDFAFWQYGAWSLLFEMGTTHYPSDKQVEKLIADNVPGVRKLFESAPTERALDHSFKGQCNGLSILFDRRDE